MALWGVGLHTGANVRVALTRGSGPVTLGQNGVEAVTRDLSVVSTERATTVEACGGSLHVGTVEHALAALAGLGIYEGVTIGIDGPEMPLLDGGSAQWCEALRVLGVPGGAPRCRVARPGVVEVGTSRYTFEPGSTIDVAVRVVFDEPPFDAEAGWGGDGDDFCDRIAPARTFALAREIEHLAARGLVRHVAPEAVVVLASDRVMWAGRPFQPDEPARHKLLDFLGDSYIHGGPALGRIRALRPGHRANHRALERAWSDGILVSIQ